ncbi:hypothetical protein EVAR_8375_1 [Eumeta japonica]|uniref:Uncharacterized protein n=1 Tax=Eumeta variegata TaxID=151549 RepID=A0A4C1VDC8_EUMVA|nr:hypothetical protein EVAR_8375_1 [Eumeta japonica]
MIIETFDPVLDHRSPTTFNIHVKAIRAPTVDKRGRAHFQYRDNEETLRHAPEAFRPPRRDEPKPPRLVQHRSDFVIGTNISLRLKIVFHASATHGVFHLLCQVLFTPPDEHTRLQCYYSRLSAFNDPPRWLRADRELLMTIVTIAMIASLNISEPQHL